MAEITLEEQTKKTIGWWCHKLTWRWRVGDPAKVFDPAQADLEGLCWTKVCDPKTSSTLGAIWDCNDPGRGGVRGVSKFLSVLCTNTYKDEHRRLSAKSPEIFAVQLDAPIPGEENSPGRVIDAWTDESFAEVPDIFFEDLRGVLTPEEFQVFVEDHLQGGHTVREVGDLRGFSKSTADRIIGSAAKKVAEWGSQNKSQRIHYLVRLNQRTRYNPARIYPEVRDSWLDSVRIIPFSDCSHLADKGGWMGQNFDIGGVPQPGRYALCSKCWQWYWMSVCEWLQKTRDDIALELALDRIATQGLAVPSGAKEDLGALFTTERKEIEQTEGKETV